MPKLAPAPQESTNIFLLFACFPSLELTHPIPPLVVDKSPKAHHILYFGTHRTQRVHIGKNISVSFQSLGGGIDPAGQNERSVDDFVSLWTSSE